ncbi:protein kinase [Naegleria gruberi]|uniref:Protein kinase n=1 Tax=Naegleria gruberi TaxID=5762 RepID=D2VDH4_NAEGR|nr:protein kinase [Naegleria gruberi]EFC45235.1 protein kinase [Naegleria gruberi]|eukprot:XP_002677979.1 protein kinase [Naegleria gruberi]
MIISSSNGSSSSSEENPFSRYSNIVRIGQGAFGSVFKVSDIKHGNKLKAIKLIRFESFTDLNTIMKEASQLSHINHPNIIKVNDYFITNDNLLIIDMDYYECGDLTNLLKHDEVVSEKLLKQILKQMLSALKLVHEEMHIIHRDIKPTNIFIKKLESEKIEIVLADFGLAKKFQESKGQSYAGTPLYMSPEIALGSSYSFNTDIFSLGVSIYQIMTKDKETSISNLLMGIQSQNAINILTKQMKQSNDNEYSNDLIEIVLQMLEKDSKQRPNASQLLSLNYFK